MDALAAPANRQPQDINRADQNGMWPNEKGPHFGKGLFLT
ncbi:hypothetical protein GCM10028803_60830 [Larkinella knui]